jgi:3-phenylpropionate/trans-cinnamate dioxygenase ferredoxin reductase component
VSDRIVVVGAGLAGVRTVEGLRREGLRGPLSLVGEELEAPYDRPPLSKQVLRGERDVAPLAGTSFADLGVEVRLGSPVTSLDTVARCVALADGSSLTYRALVIATGAYARRLPGQDALEGIHVLRTAADARRLRADLHRGEGLVVVGGGFIGCEVAASARQMGVPVTLVEALGGPLLRQFGAEVSAMVQKLHEEHGVRVRAGVQVAQFLGDGRVAGVRLADGTEIAGDTVLVGLGAVPATEWLRGSGVEVGDGVLCDEYGRTNVPAVYAVGDVARFATEAGTRRIEHWTNATEMAWAVARTLASGQPVPHRRVPYVWSDQYEVKIQAIGQISPRDEITVHKVGPKERLVVLFGPQRGTVSGAVGFSAPALMARLRALVGTGASRAEAEAILLH